MIEVTVADVGPESANIACRLFPAVRFQASTTGWDLAYPFKNSIIETHGGQLTAKSKAGGGGATLRFTIPSDGGGGDVS